MIRVCLAAGIFALATPLAAADLADAELINETIIGNTVEGEMESGGPYAEFYDEDGTIRALDYTGEWSVEENQLCFDYGEESACWDVMIDGDEVTWMVDGKAGGTGIVLKGNPKGY
ncbi:hypothetical protein K1T73_08040 [Roseovarius sp. SCSIO 43702]|uniref:hypothetical protein n=1 Tax=Roseovarius sp. SCSIO 43702 TaxID=2823043 RepID=UPI001C735783|nr:hypothetical protein [Roseovarius sp. SCSIO 43702]QYX58299.1 hypothetical protein K1T73_08040 [Roseovarius sp. SCSIO 43702]